MKVKRIKKPRRRYHAVRGMLARHLVIVNMAGIPTALFSRAKFSFVNLGYLTDNEVRIVTFLRHRRLESANAQRYAYRVGWALHLFVSEGKFLKV